MIDGEKLKILSANCQGLRDKNKRPDVINYFNESKAGVICLQDTHLTVNDAKDLRQLCNCECILSGSSTNSRGVAIILKNNFEYEITQTEIDPEGNYICLDLNIPSFSIRLISIYAPNVDKPLFFENLNRLIEENNQNYILICGDFNLVLNPKIDTYNYININNPRSRNKLLEIMQVQNLPDAYRSLNPEIRRYTWRRKHPVKQARLDYFIISESLLDITGSCKINQGYRSDHSIIEINLVINHFHRGPGIWKFNCALLKNPEYINIINKAIMEFRLKYALPIYSIEYIKHASDLELQFSIDDEILLEMLMLELRGLTIKFSKSEQRKRNSREDELMKLIEQNEAVNCPEKPQANIEELKKELLSIREVKMKGHMIRSRTQWLQCGEKPTKYFCGLEHRNFVDKTIKKICLENGKTLTKQSEILQEVQHYYSNLFKSRDDKLNGFNLNKHLKGINITKLNKIDAASLEGPLTTDELGHALRNMKHNKTPGIDGFPAEFLKMFSCKIKYLITRVLNNCYKTGILPISLRQTIINFIPKGDKSRDCLKNWRPISLLSTFYKLASASLATRMKSILDTLISDSQTGFVKGRYIGESIRLVYDIMNYTEVNKTDGLLMLIDFEKAFDSISWKFMYKVLDIFGFPESYIKWIKLLNTSIIGAVVQAGVKSEFLKIERGCKQGDPIAPYLFILCGQILSYMIKDNNNIKGIHIGGHEFKITQFADDTTLFLNGTQNCLQAALNTLELFGSFSGLKMNTSKTKVIWIGRKKQTVEKLNVNSKLQWGTDSFSLLGIQFSVDLELIPSLNYNKAMDDAWKLLNVWKKRNLTPFGKITIIKTFFLI